MLILHDLLKKLKNEFSNSRKGDERGTWFIYTLLAIIIPFTSSKTSNLLRCLKTVFGFAGIRKKRFYTFMASPKIPWQRLWQCLWRLIPESLTKTADFYWLLTIALIPRPEKRYSDAILSLTMPPNKISPNIHGRKHFAFSDVRRLIAEAALDDNFNRLFPVPQKSVINSLVAALMRMTA